MPAPFIIDAERLRLIKSYTDPTIDVLWNERRSCFVVVQELPGKVFRTSPELLGCPAVTGPMTRFKYLVDLRSAEGRRIEPSPEFVKIALETKTVRADDPLFEQMTGIPDVEDPNEPIDFDQLRQDDEARGGPLYELEHDMHILRNRKTIAAKPGG
jgi:hypothetical protein